MLPKSSVASCDGSGNFASDKQGPPTPLLTQRTVVRREHNNRLVRFEQLKEDGLGQIEGLLEIASRSLQLEEVEACIEIAWIRSKDLMEAFRGQLWLPREGIGTPQSCAGPYQLRIQGKCLSQEFCTFVRFALL